MFQVLKLQQKIENLKFSYTETDGVEHQYNLTKGKTWLSLPWPGPDSQLFSLLSLQQTAEPGDQGVQHSECPGLLAGQSGTAGQDKVGHIDHVEPSNS